MRRRAFTLVEVLAALALFALAVVVLAGAYLNVLSGVEAVRSDRVLEQEMRFIRERVLLEPEREKVEEGGELTGDLGRARWTATIESTTVADLFRVELRVEFEGSEGGAGPFEETQVFTVLRPRWSEPVEREELRSEARQRIEERRRSPALAAGGTR